MNESPESQETLGRLDPCAGPDTGAEGSTGC